MIVSREADWREMRETGQELQRFCESVEQLTTVDLGGRGVVRQLLEAAREIHKASPTALACAALEERLTPKQRTVFILTGFPDRPWIAPEIPESDGPPGAAVLARALQLAFDSLPVFVAEESFHGTLVAACRGAGFSILELDAVKKALALRNLGGMLVASLLPFPISDEAGRRQAVELIEEHQPACVISIERPGPNEKGVTHGGNGRANSEWVAKLHHLVVQATDRGCLTIGIGDGGNEIGMGTIRERVKRCVPYGSKCLCPDGSGIADATRTDHILVGSVSNWAAYGLCAALAFSLRRRELLHPPEMEERILAACAASAALSGGPDGSTLPDVDGIPLRTHLSLVTMLNDLLDAALEIRDTSTDR